MFKHATLLTVLLLSGAHLSGCAVASAGIKKGDERSFVRSLNDVNAGRAVEARLKRAHAYEMGGVDVEVSEGVVLLSGNVPRKEDRIEASRIAWSAPHIYQVGNEILIKDKQGFVRNTKDGFLEKSVRARLTADKYVKARNFNVETHDGIVYLLGVARDPAELDRAARIASLTRGTTEVISYVRIEGQPVEIRSDARPQSLSQAGAQAQMSGQRQLPDFLTTQPLPLQDQSNIPAPMRQAPMGQSIPYSASPAPYDLGQTQLPTNPRNTFPVDPDAPPFYIDPETGQQIEVKNWTR